MIKNVKNKRISFIESNMKRTKDIKFIERGETIIMSCKMTRETKKFMEREIRQYNYNKHKLEGLKQNTKISTRRLLYLEERIYYVEHSYNRLNDEDKKIYDLIFKERL